MDPLALTGMAASLALHFVRTASFVAVVPLFGRQRDSWFLRLILAVALAAVFYWTRDQVVAAPAGPLALGMQAVREAFVGLALGFALHALTTVLTAAGEVVSTEMGFSMARIVNPESGVDATVVSQLFSVFGFLLILQFDVHHEALRILEQTWRACPVGQPFALEPIWNGIRLLISHSLLLALQYSFPILGLMLLLTLGMVLLGRAVPAINLMEFGFTARVLAALAVVGWFLTEGTPFLLRAFTDLMAGARAMFPG
jgi:flagellar biosynthetic protein FliR